MKLKRRRRRMTHIHPTEKPSLYVILGCLVIGVSLLICFFNPYNQITSPLPPQPESSLAKYQVPGLPNVPMTHPKPPSPANTDTAVIPAPAPQVPPSEGELIPAQSAPLPSAATNADGVNP